MLETKITTSRATFSRVEAGDPPTVAFHKILTRSDGKQKYIALSVPIPDARLLARVVSELRTGDEIEVTIETRWTEDGIPKTLLDFAKVPASQEPTGQDQRLVGAI